MFMQVVLVIGALLVMSKIWIALRLNKVFAQMWGGPLTIHPSDPQEQEIVRLSLSYFREVVLMSNSRTRLVWVRFVLYLAWYLSALLVSFDVFVVIEILHVDNLPEKAVAFLGAMSFLGFSLLFLMVSLIEICLSGVERQLAKRERKWMSAHNITEASLKTFQRTARKAYDFKEYPHCSLLCWLFPLSFWQWIVYSFSLLALTVLNFLAITKAVDVAQILLPDLMLLLLLLIGGLPGLLYHLMRVARWDGISAGMVSIPFCCFWTRFS
jgi:hypothetical protein